MDVPAGTSQIDGENVTKYILKDLIAYRTSTSLSDWADNVKMRMRNLSDKIKIEMDVKDSFKPKDLLTNVKALEAVIHSLYLYAETKEQHVLYTVCLFTYVGKLCKNLALESHQRPIT